MHFRAFHTIFALKMYCQAKSCFANSLSDFRLGQILLKSAAPCIYSGSRAKYGPENQRQSGDHFFIEQHTLSLHVCEHMDSLGIEARALRMRSGGETTTPKDPDDMPMTCHNTDAAEASFCLW